MTARIARTADERSIDGIAVAAGLGWQTVELDHPAGGVARKETAQVQIAIDGPLAPRAQGVTYAVVDEHVPHRHIAQRRREEHAAMLPLRAQVRSVRSAESQIAVTPVAIRRNRRIARHPERLVLNDPTLADAIMDRLIHRAHKIHRQGKETMRECAGATKEPVKV
jgi:hypothetical protein